MAHGEVEDGLVALLDEIRHDVDAVLRRRVVAIKRAAVADVLHAHIRREPLDRAILALRRRRVRALRGLRLFLALDARLLGLLPRRLLRRLPLLHDGERRLIMARGKMPRRPRRPEDDGGEQAVFQDG